MKIKFSFSRTRAEVLLFLNTGLIKYAFLPIGSLYLICLMLSDKESVVIFQGLLILSLIVGAVVVYITKSGKLTIAVLWFSFLQIIFMPFVYFTILNNNPDDFIINKELKERTKKKYIEDIKNEFHPLEQKRQILFIDSLSSENLSKISLDSLSFGKLYYMNGYTVFMQRSSTPNIKLHASVLPRPRKEREDFNYTINFSKGSDRSARFVTFNSLDIEFMDLNLKQFFRSLKIQKNQKIEIYNKKLLAILNNKIWKYEYLIPHCLNITTSGNLIPASTLTNIIVFFHRFVIDNFTIGIMLSIAFEKIMGIKNIKRIEIVNRKTNEKS
ncbi:hypothetical protein ACFPVY_02335 [Flavobacterium qiangtangense]|uniref:Uncharacterized protein n=1 Tax=Flavobacterium qiangtangense TaxID=1442595 RepID=A0ABW1PIT9_9FLAO